MSLQNEDKRWWLSSVLGDDATQYFDLDYAVSIIKQGKLAWQAAASIAVQISLFNQNPKPTRAEKALAQHIADSAIEPLEALVKSIAGKSDKESAQENEARTLFHARFALGGLYIVRGDIERATDILTQVASTKSILEVRRVKSSDGIYEEHTFVEGRERVSRTADIFLGKTLASHEIWIKLMAQGSYEKALYLLTQAAASFPWEATFMFIVALVDFLTKRCIELKNVGQWVSLIDALAEIASICDGDEEIEEFSASPSACKITSSNYWAWKFGQIVGDLWLKSEILVESIMEDCYPSLDEWKNGLAFVSLYSECDEKRDWEIARTFYLEMWERTSYYSGTQLFQEGADSSLYWAMRVGLADKFLKRKEPEIPKVDRASVGIIMSPKAIADLQEILDRKFPKRPHITERNILELIHSGESKTVEFKSSARWDYHQEAANKALGMIVVKTIAAFLNGDGGKLLIGVSDDKKVLGLDNDYKTLDKRGRDSYEQFLVNLISANIGTVFCSEYVTFDFCDIDGNDVCLLNAQPSVKPVFVSEAGDKNLYIRPGNLTRKLNSEEAYQYISIHWPKV